MQQLQDRPPFVRFEVVSVEDRAASIKAGHYVGMDVDYAFITPAGSKDRIERVVSEWLPQVRKDVEEGRMPESWYNHFNRAYSDFKAGNAVAVNGTPVRDWPGLSPTMHKTLQSLHLLAIEDVAAANEQTIAALGMGGRQLKQRAIDYLAAAKDVGKVAEETSALRVRAEEAEARNDALAHQLQILSAQVAALTGDKPAPIPESSSGISMADLTDETDLGKPL